MHELFWIYLGAHVRSYVSWRYSPYVMRLPYCLSNKVLTEWKSTENQQKSVAARYSIQHFLRITTKNIAGFYEWNAIFETLEWMQYEESQCNRNSISLQKQAYSNILKILPPKYKHFQIEKFLYFHISAQNGLWAVLTSTHNPCFWAERRKIMYTPVNPSFII